MTEEQIGSEIGNLVFAGTDTTSTTLTYLFWQLAQCKWQDRLREELHNVLLVDKIAKFEDVNDCPILDAVISESLRLFPAAPASLQRETPAGGRALNGCFIPGGVSCHLLQAPLRVQRTSFDLLDRLSFQCSATRRSETRPSFRDLTTSILLDGCKPQRR
jgi:hypothetical protein